MRPGHDLAVVCLERLDAVPARALNNIGLQYEQAIARARADYVEASDCDRPSEQDMAFFRLIGLARQLVREIEDEAKRQARAHQERMYTLRRM